MNMYLLCNLKRNYIYCKIVKVFLNLVLNYSQALDTQELFSSQQQEVAR